MAADEELTPLERAIAFAVEQHAGQVDRYGRPYILHPLRLMHGMDTDEERMTAALHDVLEDCPGVTLADLARLGVPPAVLKAVALLTHAEDVSWDDYIARLAPDPIARKVKLADLADNMDLRRTPELRPNDLERYNRYIGARRVLLAAQS
jgi:(p)ppGpp synthase/HD superfamily hydrolase